MTDQDRSSFVRALEAVASIYRHELTELAVEMYFESLRGYQLEDVSSALGRAVKGGRFFPVPADLIESINSQPAYHKPEGWGQNVKQVDRSRSVLRALREKTDEAPSE